MDDGEDTGAGMPQLSIKATQSKNSLLECNALSKCFAF